MMLCRALIAFVLITHTAQSAERPNVLFLFADDMRADSIAALGHPAAITPHLDALVRRGFVMRNAYCFGGNSPAVCTPSRNMLLSGQAFFRWSTATPTRDTLFAPANGPNLPATFNQAGYFTYHHGKKGNTAPPIQALFQVNKYLGNDEAERRSGEPGKEIADDAIAFLKERSQATDAKPFCMYLAFGNPHDPRVAAPLYLAQYDRAALPLPKNWLPVHPFNNGEMAVRDEQLLPWPRTEADLRQTHHEYLATITALDFHIGRILKALEDLKQLDNTLIVFSADQGIAVGSHGLLGKQNLYEHSMKAPLIFAGPGIAPGASDALVHLFDIFPTLCTLTGITPPANIDGRSFQPVLKGESKTARPELMLAYREKQRAIRDDRWKLIRYLQVDVTQLFDVQNDPDEMHNLADEPAQRERVNGLLDRLTALQKNYGDPQPLSVRDPQPKAWTPPVTSAQ